MNKILVGLLGAFLGGTLMICLMYMVMVPKDTDPNPQPPVAELDGKCRDSIMTLTDTVVCPHEDHTLKTKKVGDVDRVICECEE